jgi:hypothetical protein
MHTLATPHPARQRTPARSYACTVRVLDIHKKTARIEVVRGDGRRVRRFVKLARLTMTGRESKQ